jgi:hypothetical protein
MKYVTAGIAAACLLVFVGTNWYTLLGCANIFLMTRIVECESPMLQLFIYYFSGLAWLLVLPTRLMSILGKRT